MRVLTATILLAGIVVLLAATARADGCPIKNDGADYLTLVSRAIQAKPCGEAKLLAESCALGASGDTVIAGTASEICQKGFSRSKDDTALFARLAKRCSDKYAKQDGTMYISMAAFCQLDVAVLLNQLNAPVE